MYFKEDFLLSFFIFLGLLLLLYFISRKSIQELYLLLVHIFRSKYISIVVLAIFFYPGTVIHELSHFIMAVLLRLRVYEFNLIPHNEGNTLRLGYVLFERKDPIRGIIVGIAPFLVGTILLWWLYGIHFFGNDSLGLQLTKSYLTFTLTSTMFSSKQDLVDLIYIIPIILLLTFGALYWSINIIKYITAIFHLEAVNNFMYAVTINSAISIFIHIVIILVCISIRRLLSIHYFI